MKPEAIAVESPFPRRGGLAARCATLCATLCAAWALALLGPLAAAAAPPDGATPPSPTLAKLRAAGVITLGYRSASVPFSYLGPGLQPIGYTMDICQRVVTHLRRQPGLAQLEVKLMPVSSGTRLPLVANGTVDIECGVTTHTVERRRSLNFSLTYFVAESRLLSKRERPIPDLEALRGQAVASTIGTTSIQLLHSLNQARGLDLRILAGLDDVDSIRLLDSDQALAFAMDDVLLRGLMLQAKNASHYVASEKALSVEPYGLPLPPGDPAFKQLVDEALRQLFASGEIHALYKRWFESPIRPQGLNLKLPMSPALRRAIASPTDSAEPAHYR